MQDLNAVKLSEVYKEVELNEEELQLALFEARKKKFYENRRREWIEKIGEEKVFPTLTAEQLAQYVIKKGNEQYEKFEIDDDNKEIFSQLCLYFSGDRQFKDTGDNFSLNKGILLFGDIGCGKTALMRLFMDNSFRSFALINCANVANEYQEHGTSVMDKYTNEYQSSRPDLTFGQKLIGICFDDLGTEVIKKNYGNASNVMADVLFQRHANAYKLAGQTHLTTNLIPEQIGEMYGDRIRSRMREMFNVISFPSGSKDRRK